MSTFQERLQAALSPTYTLERELVGGGMSHVYLATESALGRQVVVKVLPPELAAGVNRDRFRREIQLAAQLQHPHIVPLLTAGEHGDFLYYTMPYVTGESLRARLEQGRFAIRDVVRILTDVVDALAYAHAHGVIHRDIKPGNVLTQRSHALVTDFGVAKALSAALPLAGMTTSGLAIGTPAYMAPEQLAADPAADHRVDLYAVGLLGYELLTGEAPFTGASPAQTMAAQLTRDPEPLPLKRPDVPPQLAAIIARCLSKEPDARPASAETLLEELESVPHEPFTPTRPVAPLPRVRGRRNVLLGAGVTAFALIAAFALRGRGHDRTAELSAADTAAIEAAVDSAGAASATLPAPPATPASPAAAASASAVPNARLTRADSLAIANAVRREIARETEARARSAERALHPDSVSKLFRMRFVDSLTRMSTVLQERFSNLERGSNVWMTTPPADASGRRQAVILSESPADLPGIREVDRRMVDTLRTTLRNTGKYRVRRQTSPEGVQSMTPEQLAKAVSADVVLTLTVVPLRGDSLRAILVLDDPAALPQYTRRAVGTRPAPISDPLRGVDQLVTSTVSMLDQMAKSPRLLRVEPPTGER